jgi:hypothetical protein
MEFDIAGSVCCHPHYCIEIAGIPSYFKSKTIRGKVLNSVFIFFTDLLTG